MNIKKYSTAVFVVLLVAVQTVSFAQSKSYVPLTTWPYMYEDFQQGWITTIQGGKINYDQVNISLVNGSVHYVQNGTIMEANAGSIGLLTIGQDSYVYAAGGMIKVLKNTLYGAVAQSNLVDYDTLNRVNIGYGTSSLASTQNLAASALDSPIDFTLNKKLEAVTLDRDGGTPVPLKTVTGIYLNGVFYPAVRSEIMSIPGIDKDAVKDFLKKEKIKLNDIDDLGKLVDYLYTIL